MLICLLITRFSLLVRCNQETCTERIMCHRGRCADYALEDDPFAVSVWVKASLDKRVDRIKKMYDLSESKATDLIQKTDKRRASYYNYYSSKKWGEAKSYDLCLDSGELGIDGSIELILKYIELKEKNLAK